MDDKLNIDVLVKGSRYPLRVPRGITPRALIEHLNNKKDAKINIRDGSKVMMLLPLDLPLESVLFGQIEIEIRTGTLSEEIEDRL